MIIMSVPFLSIIIPLYNKEEYIERCLSSVLTGQNISECEVIVIDDGSSDGGAAVAGSIAYENKHLTLVRQDNQGLSATRNRGIDMAKGKYIMLLDADDYIAEGSIEEVITLCRENNLDMLRIRSARMYGERIVDSVPYEDTEIHEGKEVLTRDMSPCAPFCVYRKSFLDEYHLRFLEGIFHEDNEFTPRAFYYAKRVMACNSIVYYVCFTENSITRTPVKKRIFDLLIVADHLYSFAQHEAQEIKHVLCGQVSIALNEALTISMMHNKDVRRVVDSEIAQRSYLRKCLMFGGKGRWVVESVLLLIFPKHATSVFRALQVYKR